MLAKNVVAIMTLLAQSAQTAPTSNESKPQLAKRAGEGIHFLNCPHAVGMGTDKDPDYSIVVYCPDDKECNSFSFSPDRSNVCVMSRIRGTYHPWEGSGSCTFPSGVTFRWSLPYDSQSKPNYSLVSSVGNTNGYRTDWKGYKDDGHTMISYGATWCKSIYYFV